MDEKGHPFGIFLGSVIYVRVFVQFLWICKIITGELFKSSRIVHLKGCMFSELFVTLQHLREKHLINDIRI